MTENQERALLPLVSALKAHGVDLVTIDEVMDLWSSATQGMRFVVPKARKMQPRRDFSAIK
jgi:hypothetical protein